MTDAEKMREAAAQVVESLRTALGAPKDQEDAWLQGFKEGIRAAMADAKTAIRALPIPDAPASDRQQAGLLDEAMSLLDTYERRSEHAWDCMVRSGKSCDCGINTVRSATGDLLDRMRAARPSAGLLDEVKAALVLAYITLECEYGSGERPDWMLDDDDCIKDEYQPTAIIEKVFAAIARLEREA